MGRSALHLAAVVASALAVVACGAPPAAAPPVRAGWSPTPAAPADVARADAAFAALTALVGEWDAPTGRGGTVHASYRLVSRGTALVETWRTPSSETLTIFHRDGGRLVATHYCAQGNQPRLELAPRTSDGAFEFTFVDATNLASARDAHLVRLRLQPYGPSRFDKTEVYEANGQRDATTLAFTRAGSAKSHDATDEPAPGTLR
ncbi:MAG TPA: hypothetical protein VGM56_29145 [Byssovorax sp.]|jgi:hypothetical protein